MTESGESPRRRGGGRSRKAAGAARAAINPRYVKLRNPYPPIPQLSADELEAIHETSMTILSEIGLKVLSAEARALYRSGGAEVEEASQRVRFDPALVLDLVAKAPSKVTLHGRNPERDAVIGGDRVAFAAVGGPPNASDLDRGRRPGDLAAYRDLITLAQAFDVIHLLTPVVEPTDVAVSHRHLEMTRALVELSDKPMFVYARGREAVADSLEILRLAYGLSPEGLAAKPICYTVINANSPLQLDESMCKGIIDFARSGQFMVLTPFTLAGAMAPVTIAGALAQQNAEALAGIALAQIVKPGAPVGYGGFTSNVDMKSGAPAFGTPEYAKAAFATGQLCRRYGLPFRSSNVNASNAPDAQAAYESQMSLWGAMMGGANLLLHGAGWLEGGLVASYEKFIIDVEMLQMMAELFQPLATDEDSLGLSAVREVEPGGHYFGAQHTLARYESAFYQPLLSDWRNFETWSEAGGLDAAQRANAKWKQALKAFEAPPLEPARREAVEAFIAKRAAEGGANLEN